jgi:threonine synthase
MTDDQLHCPRCGRPGSGYRGCQVCRAEGVFVNLALPLTDLAGFNLAIYPGGPWGHPASLPIGAGATPLSLGEGSTPTVRLRTHNGEAEIWVKNEAANPTWSHKDRAMSVAVARAAERGASTVIAASSGNAGAAAAAYAARAGLRCVVLTTTRIPPALHALIASLGAVLVAYDDRDSRHKMLDAAVDELGWAPVTFIDPAIGGTPFGNEGYKSIAYECAQQFGDDLAAIVVPTCRADLLSGLGRGYRELLEAGLVQRPGPRLIAVEAESGAALTAAWKLPTRAEQERVRVTRHDSSAFSIGNEYAHWHGLNELWASNGMAVAIEEDRYLAEYQRIARENGLFIEASSAVAIAAARDIADQTDGRVLAIATSSGMKDHNLAASLAGEIPVLSPDINLLADHVERVSTQTHGPASDDERDPQ